jgi:cellulose synthase operon protein YhjU
MGAWNLYFIAKLILYWGHHIGFHLLPNLAFAVALLLPLPQHWARIARQVAAVPAGIVLLYYDSWFPEIKRALSLVPSLQSFTPGYLVELAGRLVNLWVLAAFAVAILVYFLVRNRLRVTTFVLLSIIAVPLVAVSPGGPAQLPEGMPNQTKNATGGPLGARQLDESLVAFYKQQAGIQVPFAAPGETAAPFDIVFLHICSLAWEDLAVAGQKDAALFHRFDILFDDFNTVATYSGPAAIRLLRAGCGQQRHDDLYKSAERNCYLFEQLQRVGFEPALLMNHDGKFGDFIGDVRERGGLRIPPLGDLGAAQRMKSFDNSPIYDDFDILSRWMDVRRQQESKQVALFYSTVSLHDGNIVEKSESRSSLDTYAPRLKQLLDDLDRFITKLESAGRPSVVVFIPEHGANLRGDAMQIPGMREIPSPGITHAPLGIKLVGLKGPSLADGHPQMVSAPSSYVALATLLSRFIAQNPFEQAQSNLQSYLADLPQTDFVAENENTVVTRHGKSYYIRMPDGTWSPFGSQ